MKIIGVRVPIQSTIPVRLVLLWLRIDEGLRLGCLTAPETVRTIEFSCPLLGHA